MTKMPLICSDTTTTKEYIVSISPPQHWLISDEDHSLERMMTKMPLICSDTTTTKEYIVSSKYIQSI